MKQVIEQGNISVKDSLLDFWKGFFSFNGKSTRKAFWIGIIEWIVAIILNNLIFGTLSESYAGGVSGAILNTILYGITIILIIPLTALIFRRLKDAGMKTLWITLLVIFDYVIYILFILFPTIAFTLAVFCISWGISLIVLCIPSGRISE